MEDKTELLYNSLFESGDYTKSFEEFQSQFSTEENVALLYSSLSKSGLYTKTPEEFSEQFFPNLGLKKKDEPMESTLESGSSDSFEGTPEDSFINTPVTPPREGEAVADAQAVNYGVPREGQSDLDFDEEVAVKQARIRNAEDKRSLYQRSGDIIINRENEQDNKLGFNFRDRDFTYGSIAELDRDKVIGEMEYHYGDYGFTFKPQTEWLGNEKGNVILVTAPNGDTEEITVQSIEGADADLVESKKLKKFMDKYEPIQKTGLERVEADAMERDRKILGKKDYDERMLDIQVDTRNLKDKLNSVMARQTESDRVEKELMAMSDEEFAQNIGAYQKWKAEKSQIGIDAAEVKTEWEGMAARGKELDRVVGNYTAMRAEEGSFFGGAVNEFFSSGFGRLGAAVNDMIINAASMTMPVGQRDVWAKLQKGMLNGAVKDNPFSYAAREFIPQNRKGTSQIIRERGTAIAQAMGSETSQEYVDDVGFVQGALYGVAGSIPAMVSGLPGLVAQGMDFVNQETENNPNFEGITEEEKLAMAAPMGLVMGYLERVGLQKALSGNSGATTAVLKLLQKYKIKPGNKTFTEYVDSEIKSGGKRLLMKLTASTIVEGETGMLQEISDIAFKEIYDIMKEEEMFRTPETIGEGLVQIVHGAVAEAIGGFVMGSPGAINSALTGGNFTELSDEEYATFEKVMEDESLTAAYKEKLKQDILSGNKSKEEALQELNNSEEVKGNMDEIPDYYTPAQKKKALELLTKRSKLQDIVDKGNKQLVTKEQAEIDAINDALTAMSTDTDTSTTTETDAEGNTITNTVTVDEASAKIKLEEDGIKNPTQEQIDTKQAEMLEEEVKERLKGRNKELFEETQDTSQGTAVLSDITESNENGVATGTYTNTETGDVDVVISSKGKNDFVSFSRIYEDGKPTNSWSSKMINEAGSDFSTMLTEAQKLLPEGHQWTESKSISESGLGVWNKALEKGYEGQVDSDGNAVTKSVTLNEAQKGESTSDSSDFNDVVVETKAEAEAKIKEVEAIYPGIVVKPVRVRDSKGRPKGFSFKLELPVLVKKSSEITDDVSQEDLSAIDKLAKATKAEEKEDMDVTVDKARDGDIKAQEKLDKYGLKWAKETIYRFVGKSEVDALEKGETIEGKSKTAGVDVTSSSEVTTASDAEYRITFKEDGFDDKKKGSRVRMKSEKDGWVKGGYNKSDVLKIEKKNEDGTYETVYDSEAEVEAEAKKPKAKTAAVKLADKIKKQEDIVEELEEDVRDSQSIWLDSLTPRQAMESSMNNVVDAETAEIIIELEAAQKKLAELKKAPKKKVSITDTDSTNPSFEKGSMKNFTVEGGVLEIGKVKGAKKYSILRMSVDEDSRRQGKASELLNTAISYTKGMITGMASNDAAVALNYKLGMRAFSSNGKELSLAETKAQRAENAGESIRMEPTPKKKPKAKAVKKDDAPKRRLVVLREGESIQDAIRRTRVAKKTKGAKKSTPKGLVYTAAFVNDTESLSKKYPSELPNKEGGHMTVSFKPNSLNVTTGEKTSLKVVGRLTTDKVDVLILENDKSTNATPHITLATAKGVSPATSNQEIKNNQDKIIPLDETVEATYGYFDSKKGNITKDNSEPPKVETVAVVAPYFNTTIKTLEEAKTLRQKKNYKEYKKTLVSIGKALGIEVEVEETVGGYKNDAGEEIVEISNRVVLKDASLEQAEEYAALMAALTPEVQEATIAAQYINQGSSTHNANEYSISVSNKQAAIDALKAAGITDYTFNETTGEVTFIDVLDSKDKSLQDKIGIFVEELEAKKINYENKGYRPIASSYIDASKRKEILRGINGKRAESRQGGDILRKAVNKAIGRDAKFQGITAKEYKKQITQDEQTETPPESGPVAGNRLFNEPISEIAEIADRYYQRAFGTKRPNFKGTKKLDKVKAKKISDAFEAMKHSPNNPKVREAYNALVKENIAQYKTFLDAGYVVEINNGDPYANSQEMIEDLRNNKRIKIFSTESAFGDTPITPKQRKENPLLATTTFTDVNGKPMLVNDLFRAIHDFFGHAELGNSFGPIGEENAWNVHARMYSPLARKAMTTETRAQNSYVNFSGINDKIDKIRKKARKLREEGKYKEALKLTNDIYEKTFFADQKVGILAEEFYQIPEEEKKVVRTTKPLTKKEEEAAEAEFIKIAGKPKSKKRAAYIKKENEKAAYIKKQNEKARFRLKTKAAEDSESNPAEVKKFLSFLNLSFPNVTISTNLKEFNKIIETDGVKAYLKGDEILYGVTTEGDIYINPDTNNSDSELYNTAIHEMSHIWTDYLETTEKGREILAKGIELVKKTEIYQEQLEEFDGDTESAAKEALSILIGNKGQTIAKSSIKSRFEKWLRGVWNYIKKKFKVSTKTKVEDLTLEEFIDLSLGDILGGKEIKTTPEQREAMRSLAKFSKKGSKSELTKLKNIVVKAIKDIRAQGKSDSAIKTLLESRGINSALVSELMAKETSSQTTKILGDIESDKISISEADLLKAQIKAFNRGAKDMKSTIKKASEILAKEVEGLVKKEKITTKQAARIITKFAKTDVTSETQVEGFVDYMTNIYNKSEDTYRNSLIVKIQKLIKKNTKVTRTAANRIKGKGLDAESQQFFAAMNRVLDGILKTKSEEINEKDFTKKFFPDIEVILQKDPNSLTTKENSQLFAYMSFNSLRGIRNMTLEEVEQLLEDVKLGTKGGRSDLQAKRMAEKAEMDELRAEADASINEGYKGLLNPDGTYINRNRINDKSELTKRIKARNRGVLNDIKVWKENYIFTDLSKWIESLGSNLKNLKTLTNSLDKEGNFFDKNVHAPLRKMETETIKGIESEKINKLDEIASSIKGVKNYNAILKLLSKGINSKVEGLTDSEGNPVENDMFPLDILLRWYALSKNEVQRKKLLKQGFTEEKLAEIKVELGPELVEFADKVIEYLSSEYFETINKVYKLVNNVNLVQIENYFPTQSVLDAVSSSLIQEGDWNAVLSKMNEGATKLRTNTEGDVLLTATDFTTALESHLEEMERYKAYAEGSLKLEKIFKFPSVNSLLNTLGVMQSVKNAINFAINPDGGKAAIQANGIDKLMTQYTGFALATKIMQIGKQATSAIWAFEKYNFRGKGKTRIPGVDLAMYMVDTAEVIATFPFQLAKAYKMSAVLRDRFRKAFKGDVRGLESGSRVAKEQRRTRVSIWKKLLRFGLGSTTTIGDIMGVMGYMATYNRDIRNGMDPEVALAKFEEFNETQQSRMNLDKVPLQMKSNYLVRGFTMFGSTLFLAINKVMQNTTNIQRAMRKFTKTGKAKDLPTQEMFRGLFLAAGVANVFFVAMANAFKYISGDDDDQEEVMQRMVDAMLGLNLIYQIPYLGSTVEEAVNKSRGIYRPGDSVVNPLTSIFRKWARLQKKAEQSGKDSDYKAAENALRIAFEMYSGTQLDFFEGIYGLFDGDFSEEDMYKVLGVSSSYQPKNAGSSNTESKPKKKTKEKSKSDSFDNDGFDKGFGNDGFDDEGF